jgi:hypothetical protein
MQEARVLWDSLDHTPDEDILVAQDTSAVEDLMGTQVATVMSDRVIPDLPVNWDIQVVGAIGVVLVTMDQKVIRDMLPA